ncbi:MAG TPA: SGNH/GDSL hydrolase family protein [Baekduia sp.]|uniref:SGNH/GDSL hydrolase family protein n=1 Tax=Baekduia sp. TaxID=2600305 RepID=UPI002CC1F055|nr:SGNH/GDSL hydrolase family protein [Baekduia sp.]HMJ32483.1 SGNH/GDSL hydrolase family protein [Baekduia sp.]
MQSITRRLIGVVTVACALSGGVTAAAYADNYVALGDSYSSGTGTRDYSLSSGCQRGPYAYPALIKADRPGTNLTFVACSGARTGDVLANQVQSLSTTTNVVTITIGGNDAGFSSVITQCAYPLVSCNSNITTAQNYINNTLPGALNGVYSQIQSRAPNARVVVLGYPRLFMGVDCNAGTFFSTDEMTKLNATADMMRNVISARAAAYGFTFRDAIPPFTGHAVCSSTEWINGLSNPVSDSYHPNRTGHKSGYEPLVRSVIG